LVNFGGTSIAMDDVGIFYEKVFANTSTNNKGNKIFYTLFAQHVSTLAWVLFRCS
jgi:hypothetical protein